MSLKLMSATVFVFAREFTWRHIQKIRFNLPFILRYLQFAFQIYTCLIIVGIQVTMYR